MRRVPEILEHATELVREEQAAVRNERDALEEFREEIRLIRPQSKDQTESSNGNQELVERYRSTVLAADDHDPSQLDSLEESLERELSPSLAKVLLSDETITPRLKRNLLLRTTEAIDERTHFLEDLQTEAESLEAYAEVIGRVRGELQTLPDCTLQGQSLDKLVDVWEQYERLEHCCDRMGNKRQQQLSARSRQLPSVEVKHAMNRYLYDELETQYPVLDAVTRTYSRITERKSGSPGQNVSRSVSQS